MRSETNWQSLGIGIIAILIFCLTIWALFHELTQAPWQFITVLVALLGALITFAGNLQIQIRNDQKGKKVEIYDKVINLFFDSILGDKLGKETKTQEEIVKSLSSMIPDLILWASDDVLNLYIEFRTGNNQILSFGKLLLAMRKDLGHQNNGMSEKSVLGTFVNDIENL